MFKLNNKIFILSLVTVSLFTACSPKKYSFKIDAPPKYSSKYRFKTMSIDDFNTDKSNATQNFKYMLKSGISKEGYISIQKNSNTLLTGNIQIGDVQKESSSSDYSCKKKIDGKKVKSTCYNYTFKKNNTIKIDFTLSKNGSTIYGDSMSESFEDSWHSSKSASKAKAKAPSDKNIINDLLKKLATRIVNAVSPHKETVSRELQEGESDAIALGITYVENGRLEQALAIWDQALSQATSNKDKSAAYYNIAVIKESQGAYRDAFDLYSKANVIMPKEKLYIKAMTRVENLSKKTETTRKWKQ